ncbi:MAG TPA: choice-of-anchor tandem repeat GloVer-containing protein [Verrucomicrobiae bacterium]|nr:choice-of-anchor tandem repeat GloVer-containing protein [Verrucomicrobiae bacterium]
MTPTFSTKTPTGLLTAVLFFVIAGSAPAQTFKTLHSFSNGDGSDPEAALTLSGATLYGTTSSGGAYGYGAVFALSTNGLDFTNIHSFTALNNYTNSDGANPQSSLVLSGNTLFGTAPLGGKSGNGVVFSLHTDGSAFKTLHNFSDGVDGSEPHVGLVLSGATLYGTASFGGKNRLGTVFSVGVNGNAFTTLASFGPFYYDLGAFFTFSGANPDGPLILSGTTLYGTASGGGYYNGGVAFGIGIDGGNFTVIHHFGAIFSGVDADYDGTGPTCRLLLSGNRLYGTTAGASASYRPGDGTVFAVNTGGGSFTNLHDFNVGGDGAFPYAGLVLSGSTLYGAATTGGSSQNGTLFSLGANGADFMTLYSFTNGSDGAAPYAGLVVSGNTLYGAASTGGKSGDGAIFSLLLEKSSLQVSISPPAAITAGAQWQVDSGPYMNSSATAANLLIGVHTIAFKPIAGSFTPSNQLVTITPCVVAKASAIYTNATVVFGAAQGAYVGLFAPTNGPRAQTNSGAITLTVTSVGRISGKLTIGGNTPSFTGQFNRYGTAALVIPRKGLTTLTVALQLDFADKSVQGSVSDGSFFTSLEADKEVFSSTEKATAYQGQYTMIIPGANDPLAGPYGTSYGTVTVAATGGIAFAGSLADGTSVTQTSFVSKDGAWPFYLPLYNNNGSIWSWNYFTHGALIGTPGASWINRSNALYRAGFTNQTMEIISSPYRATQVPLLPLTNALVTLDDGNDPPITNQLLLTRKNVIVLTNSIDKNKLVLAITINSGLISGSFVNPTNSKHTNKVSGVLLQNQSAAAGYYLGTNQNGAFFLTPN